jgi:hypothetical protein
VGAARGDEPTALRRDQGKQQHRYGSLACICGWFTENFDPFDLKEAKALPNKLA